MDVVTVTERTPAGIDELLEPVRVDILRRDIEHVPTGVSRRRSAPTTFRTAETRACSAFVGADGGASGHSSSTSTFHAQRLARAQGRRRERRALLLPSDRDATVALDEGDWSEHRHTHDESVRTVQDSCSA